jgi:hypothetical protein
MLADAEYLLSGIENGTLNHEKAAQTAESMDPALLYFVIRYLREKYPPSEPTSQGVTERLLQLTSTHPSVVKRMKEGEKDSMVEWFNDSYSIRSFLKDHEEYLKLIVDKLES